MALNIGVLLLGVVFGLLMSWVFSASHSDDNRLIIALAFMLAFAVSYYGHSSVTFHAARSRAVLLRMFAASLMALALRVALVYGIKELLGHEDAAATQVYLTAEKENLKEVYAKAHPRA